MPVVLFLLGGAIGAGIGWFLGFGKGYQSLANAAGMLPIGGQIPPDADSMSAPNPPEPGDPNYSPLEAAPPVSPDVHNPSSSLRFAPWYDPASLSGGQNPPIVE